MKLASLALVYLGVLALGCQPKSKEQVAESEVPTRPPVVAAETAGGGVTGERAPPAVLHAPVPATPAQTVRAESTVIRAPKRQEYENLPSPTITEVLNSDAYVGKRIRVTGRCLGYAAAIAVGPPPLTRSDWQFEQDGVAIFVSGPLPQGCSATRGASEPTTILALVAEDTLRALGNKPGTRRRYLLRIVP